MTIISTSLLNTYANIAQQTYLDTPPFDTGPTPPVAGPNGAYVEITQVVDGPLGFQGRAFFNSSNNELVIAFTGTEGFSNADLPDLVPDLVTDLGLAVAGVSPQDTAAQAFIQQATLAAQAEVGLFGSFDVTYVGHSLGGFLAQTASASGPEGEVVVFNAPGAGGFLGFPENHPFPEDNFTYVYSDPSEWGLLGGAIHSVGTPLSDNIYYVPGSEGHALNTSGGTGLGDVLTDSTTLVSAGDGIFLPIDEALQILGATSLLDFFEEGGSGPAEPTGTAGADLLDGTSGNDFIEALGGDDTVNGNDGHDFIRGGDGDDVLNGGNGNDSLVAGDGDDTIFGGAGHDQISAFNGNDEVHGGSGNDNIGGGNDVDNIWGDSGNDTVGAGGGNDIIRGGDGDDQLSAGSGNDRVYGDDGNDRLIGSTGNDSLWGGSGSDDFVFTTLVNGETDRIFDFDPNGDQLDFRGTGLTSRSQFDQYYNTVIGNVDYVVINEGGHKILLADTRISDLTADDFIF